MTFDDGFLKNAPLCWGCLQKSVRVRSRQQDKAAPKRSQPHRRTTATIEFENGAQGCRSEPIFSGVPFSIRKTWFLYFVPIHCYERNHSSQPLAHDLPAPANRRLDSTAHSAFRQTCDLEAADPRRLGHVPGGRRSSRPRNPGNGVRHHRRRTVLGSRSGQSCTLRTLDRSRTLTAPIIRWDGNLGRDEWRLRSCGPIRRPGL